MATRPAATCRSSTPAPGSVIHTFDNPAPGGFAQFGSGVAWVDGKIIIGAAGLDRIFVYDSAGPNYTLLDVIENPNGGFSMAPGVTPSLRLVTWDDPTAGLADGSSDVAFGWLPMPPDIEVLPVATEPRHVALPADSPLAAQAQIAFDDLLGERFVALPASAGVLRDWWLAIDERGDVAPVIGAVAATADAAFEAVASGLGVVLIAGGNAELYRRPGVVTRPVAGLSPAVMALAWRGSERRPVVAAFVRAVEDSLDAQRPPAREP